LNIGYIVFYDDLVENSTVFNINVNLKDLNLFKEKAISFDIKYDIGELNKDIPQKEPLIEVFTNLIIKKKPLNNNYIIHSRVDDDLYLYQKNSYKENKRWFQLQIMVINTILKNIDENRLKELHKMSRIDYIKELSKLFDSKIPYINEIKLIIEEIPIYSISHIKNYFNKLLIYYKYDFLNPTININKKTSQFEFSQIALNNGIPFELLNYHSSAPYNNFIYSNYITNDYTFNTDIIKDDGSNLPLLFKGTFKKLNSKWTMHKKSKWYQMEYIKINDYSKETFKEFFNWFSKYIKAKFTFNNLQEITNNKLRIIKDDEDNLKLLLKDTKLFKLFMKVSNKTYPNVNSYYSNYFNLLTPSDKNDIINKIILNDYPLNDLYILSMAEILNINILTIHRAIYNTSKDDIIRGNVEDLLISTTFYKATNNHYNRPLLIFFKEYDATINESVYYLVVDKTIPISINSIYQKLSEIPNEIKILTEEHLKRIIL